MAEGGSVRPAEAGRTRVLLALLVVYVVWGSTYLAIRFAIETLPPFAMAGVRFLVAGLLLYGWRRARGAPAPPARDWRTAAVVGFFLLLAGNGGLTWGEQLVPSGLAALVVGTVPLWFVVLAAALPGEDAPDRREWGGVALGLAGVGLLALPEGTLGAGAVHPVGGAVVLAASLFWAVGSMYSRRRPMEAGPLLGTAMTMVAGGVLLLGAATAAGEWDALRPDAVSLRSAAGLAYLIVFGSLLAFSAYTWLLRVERPAVVGTYAFVNPLIAVLLGWTLADEPLTARTVAATVVIVGAVALIHRARQRDQVRPGPPPRAGET